MRAANTNSALRIGYIGPGGRGHGAHIGTRKELQKAGENIELVAVCDVYSVNRDRAAHTISSQTNKDVAKYVDYREMLAKEKLDAVCIATPDHWHAKQAIDAMEAGLNVYCEKPMTHTVEEAVNVVRTWQKTGKVMQVGVQSTSLPLWSLVREKLQSGLIGKVLMYQTEFFRNSAVGQWRTYQLKKEMNPETINWPLWLGVKEDWHGTGGAVRQGNLRSVAAVLAVRIRNVHGPLRPSHHVDAESDGPALSRPGRWRRRHLLRI